MQVGKLTSFNEFIFSINYFRKVTDVLSNCLEFMKLEKVEIGGLKGKAISGKVQKVFEEFNALYGKLGNIQYDILLPEDPSFFADYDKYMKKCTDLDRRLAMLFSQAFSDSNSLRSMFKFLLVAGSLVDRPIIAAEVNINVEDLNDILSSA